MSFTPVAELWLERRGNVKSADDILSVIKSPSLERKAPLRTQAARLMLLLHKYARENLLVANIYIKDPAVTLIKRDQKIPVIWDGRMRTRIEP